MSDSSHDDTFDHDGEMDELSADLPDDILDDVGDDFSVDDFDEATDIMPVVTGDVPVSKGVVEFNGGQYAAGLTWFTGDVDASKRLTQQRAKKLKADYYCVRQTVASQQGFGSMKMGHGLKMPSAAAMAAEVLVGEWHGVFPVDNGWWYVAVHSDAIAPQGDILFDNEQDALDYFVAQSEAFQWPQSYAPPSWQIQGAKDHVDASQIFAGEPVSMLQPVNLDAMFSGGHNKLYVLASVAAFLLVAYMGFVNPAAKESAASASLVQVKPLRPMPEQIVAPPKYLDPNAINFAEGTVPIPVQSELIRLCVFSMNDVLYPFPGWSLHEVECTGERVKATWRVGKSGSIKTLQDYIAQLPPNTSNAFQNNNFTVGANVVGLQEILRPVRLLDKEIVQQIVGNIFTGLGTFQLRHVAPKKERNRQGTRGNNRSANKKAQKQDEFFKFTLSTSSAPQDMANYFNVPGMKITDITWSVGKKVWTYNAEIKIKPEARRL